MRKRSGRPNRFAAIPNETVDDAISLDFMALSLLTVLIRHQDGWDITLAEVGAKYGYGRDAMANAMGLLQVARYVVKVRIMSAGDNQWSTEVVVYDVPATDEEIAELLASIERESDVRAVQVIEPTKSAVELAGKRRGKLAPKRAKKHDITVPPRGSAKAGVAAKDPAGDGEDQEQGSAPAKPKAPPRKAAAPKSGASKSSKSSKSAGTRLSKDQAAAVRAVEEAFPQELQDLLPSYRPQVLRDTILQALDSRTAAQIAGRVQRRWWAHGYAVDAMPEGKGIGSPVGVAVGLVRPSTDCPDPMCEDGVTIDTGADCRACGERKLDRQADHRRGQVPGQREAQGPAPEWWTCENPACRATGKGAPPEGGLCPPCQQELEAATARIAADHAAAEAERERARAVEWELLLEDAYAEHAEWEAEAAEQRAAQEASERRRREREEETRLLREQIIRENPELAAFAQSA